MSPVPSWAQRLKQEEVQLGPRLLRGAVTVVMSARYSVTGRPFAGAVELASQGAARRETARACEQLAARFGRKSGNARSAAG